jgi:hypothetical protein
MVLALPVFYDPSAVGTFDQAFCFKWVVLFPFEGVRSHHSGILSMDDYGPALPRWDSGSDRVS